MIYKIYSCTKPSYLQYIMWENRDDPKYKSIVTQGEIK